MRRILAGILVFANLAVAADFAGRWWGEAVTEGNTQPVYITLIQQGSTLKGSGGPSPTDQALLTNGKVEGRKITFDVLPGRSYPLHFELSEQGEWLKGTVKVQHDGRTVTGTVSLRRRTT